MIPKSIGRYWWVKISEDHCWETAFQWGKDLFEIDGATFKRNEIHTVMGPIPTPNGKDR